MANIITGIRIICSFALLFFPVFSPAFYALYIVGGVSVMIDGTVARKTGTVTNFGSTLDMIADFALIVVCMIKILPVLDIETWMLIWIGIIAMIKMINIVSGIVVKGKIVSVHSVMNRITGFLLFALPLTVSFIELRYSVAVVCAVTTFAAIQEGHFIRTGRIKDGI